MSLGSRVNLGSISSNQLLSLFVGVDPLRSREGKGKLHGLQLEDFEVEILAILLRLGRRNLDRVLGEDAEIQTLATHFYGRDKTYSASVAVSQRPLSLVRSSSAKRKSSSI